MEITIIGSGNMGRGIGTRAAAGGHSVTFVDTDIAEAEQAAAAVQAAVQAAAQEGAQVSAALLDDVDLGEVVVFAVWYGTNLDLARQLGERLAGRVVVDIANPLNASFDGLATAPDSSSAEDLARAAAPGVKIVKAFNTTYAGTLLDGSVADQPLDVFIAGDDADAKALVARIVTDGGMRPVDVGPLLHARYIEGMQFLHIAVQGTLGTNWGSTIKILN